MKKLFLLCSIIAYCFSAYSQGITFTTTTTTTASGTDITIKAAGESRTNYVLGITYMGQSSVPFSTLITGAIDGNGTFYNPATGSPTSFQFKVTNTSPTQATVTYNFQVIPVDGTTSTSLPPVSCSVKVVVQPGVASIGNDPQQRVFTKNDCGSTGTGSSVTYIVPADKYTAPTKDAANQLAMNDIAANGQAYANANGNCTPPYILEGGNKAQGQQEQFTVYNTAPGDTFVWSVPSNIGTIVTGQNTSGIEVLLKRLSGTQPYPYTVTLTITNASGARVITLNTQSKYCPTCPID